MIGRVDIEKMEKKWKQSTNILCNTVLRKMHAWHEEVFWSIHELCVRFCLERSQDRAQAVLSVKVLLDSADI